MMLVLVATIKQPTDWLTKPLSFLHGQQSSQLNSTSNPVSSAISSMQATDPASEMNCSMFTYVHHCHHMRLHLHGMVKQWVQTCRAHAKRSSVSHRATTYPLHAACFFVASSSPISICPAHQKAPQMGTLSLQIDACEEVVEWRTKEQGKE